MAILALGPWTHVLPSAKAFAGAVIGEIIAGKQSAEALRAGWGAFAGILPAMVFRLVPSGIVTFSYILKIVRLNAFSHKFILLIENILFKKLLDIS